VVEDVELGLPSLSSRVVGEKMDVTELSHGVQPGGGSLPALAKAFTAACQLVRLATGAGGRSFRVEHV